MDPPTALMAAAPPSETALLDFARAPSRVSREMIHEIALNDRGEDAEIHELAILKQLAPAPPLGLLPWHPVEVLELQRWCKSDSARDHFKRLFACAILLRNVAFVGNEDRKAEYFVGTSAATVIQLVRSSIALGSEASRLTLGFLLWLHGKQNHPVLRPFVSFGVLLLQIHEGLTSLLEICAWVEEDEKVAREELGDDVQSGRWLIGLNYQEDHVDAARSGQLPPEAEAVLRQMRDRLSG
jgi:hypothetical protein